jgi:Arginine/lysine/ornithine decarboxylases
MLDQNVAPIAQALKNVKQERIVPFDVPGHKHGKGNIELTNFLGKNTMEYDMNSMKSLDNLTHPISVIREAEQLAAEAFNAKYAFLMVNGTTSAVQNMIFSVIRRGDKIILPRNVHKSIINALVVCGGMPVYVDTPIRQELEIATGMPLEAVKTAIMNNPDAKALLVNNPTYYGICSDLIGITKLAHENGLKVLVDEAHGTQLYFGKDLPVSAMAAGADMAAISMHKSGGSLSQSSFLIIGENMDTEYVRQIINLTQTTSASYLLMAGLDISRKNLAINGDQIFDRVKMLAKYARDEINDLGGYYAYADELIDGIGIYDFDPTKLSVQTTKLGLTGIEVYDLLRDEYDIQIEFGDTANILAYISVGDRPQDIERLVGALGEIKRRFKKDKRELVPHKIIHPTVVMTPQEAFYADKKSVSLEEGIGKISGEMIMCYPPGIPLLAPGELITKEIVDHIEYSKEKGCSVMGTEDLEVNRINVL